MCNAFFVTSHVLLGDRKEWTNNIILLKLYFFLLYINMID